ncbi:MAG: exodeoxyribonuclease III [Burkholderiaceae bacterium]|jgi:exodeoxyribonuclease-3
MRKPPTVPAQKRLRVTTLNLNGIRSAAKKGVFDWLKILAPDVLCVQELKAQQADMDEILLQSATHHGGFHYAEKKGYSGAALYAVKRPKAMALGFGSKEFDLEGRYVRADFDRSRSQLSVISVYLPSGSSSPERQAAKFRFLHEFLPHLKALKKESLETKREFILCGDWNIAHKEIDLKNWRSNQKNSGFLPEERAWLSAVFDELGFVDVFRRLDPRPDQYTWWSSRGQAWTNNVGWRIDYQIATPGIAEKAVATSIYKDQRFSDHAPLTIDYDWSL